MRETCDATALHHITSTPAFSTRRNTHARARARDLRPVVFSFLLPCVKVQPAADAAGPLPRLRQPRGRDAREFGGVGRALLRRRADPENPRPRRLAIGAQVWRKVLTVGLLRAAGVLRGWRDRPADRRSYRSVGITRSLLENARRWRNT